MLAAIFNRFKGVYITYINSTKEYWEADFKYHFDQGKKLSDFLGMIVRLAFTGLVIRYLYSKSIGAPAHMKFSVTTFVNACCLFPALSVYGILNYRIFCIMHSYYMDEIVVAKSLVRKVWVMISAMMIASIINYGIFQLVNDFTAFNSMVSAIAEKSREAPTSNNESGCIPKNSKELPESH